MQKIKNQHFNPQASLRRFAIPSRPDKIFTFDKSSGKVFPSDIDKTACQKYFYDLKTIDHDPADPERFQIAERTFGLAESLGQAAIESILQGASKFGKSKQSKSKNRLLYRKQRLDLALFLALQYFRTPDQKESMLEMRKVMTKVWMNVMAANAGITGDDAHNFDIEFSDEVETGFHVKSTFECASQLTLPLSSYIWLFHYNDSDLGFVTSDAPVILYPHVKNLMSGEGLLSPGIEIIYTLSPQVVVSLAERSYHRKLEKHDGYCLRPITDDFVENMNQMYLQTSRQYLYGNSEDFEWAKALLEQHPEWKEPFERIATAHGPFTEGVDTLFDKDKEPSDYVVYWGREEENASVNRQRIDENEGLSGTNL